MPELKLSKLPDRTPVKITIAVSAELNLALRQYADVYHATYGEAESVAELIPYMLGIFLDSYRGFAKARKNGMSDTAVELPERMFRPPRGVVLSPKSDAD